MNTTERIKILSDLVAVNTVDQAEGQLADYLADLLKRNQIDSKKVPVSKGRDNLVASFGQANGDRVLGLTGHLDTVSLGDPAEWTDSPLKLTQRDGRLYGRGATDMKSGVAAIVIAMIELKQAGFQPKGELRLLATVDEEKNETGAQLLTQKGFADDLTALLVAEPSGVAKDDLKGLNSFAAGVSFDNYLKENQTNEQHFLTYAHNGSLDYEVISEGKTAHSSMPQLGVNAIDNLTLYLQKQQAYFDKVSQERDAVLGEIVPVNTLISGGDQINSVPAHAKLTARVRTTVKVNGDRIIADLNQLIDQLNQRPGVHLTLRVLSNKQPVKSDRKAPFFKIIQQLAPNYLHQHLPFVHVAGGTDAAQFTVANPKLPVAVIGPGNATAHQINEYVDEALYLDYIDFYKAIIKDYLG